MIKYFLLLFFLSCKANYNQPLYDLTVVGCINFADGIGRQAVGLIDCVKNDLTINFIHTQKYNPQNVSEDIQKIINNPQGHSNVAILEDLISLGSLKFFIKVPQSTIKLAYTMFEATAIPSEWVTTLNNQFDAAIVPDPFLVTIYKNSGVTIPIFVVPLGIYIDEFLQLPKKQTQNKPFVFGCTTDFLPRKNHMLLVESFHEEFGNNPDVVLKLNGRRGTKIFNKIKNYIQTHNCTNIELILKNQPWNEYINFMHSLDCFISLAKGEGFSITPREAMAASIPCILANNTAQHTICDTGYVLSIKSEIMEPAIFPHLSSYPIGKYFTCDKNDVKIALREMYTNYEAFLAKTEEGRIWVQCYLYKNLHKKYLTLIKPKKVILGTENIIDDEYLMTDSEALYKKYQSIV